MGQTLLWVGEGEDVGAFVKRQRIPYNGEMPKRVWTLFGWNDPKQPPALPFEPEHLRNAFIEDRGHDWEIRNGVFAYMSRVVENNVWLLLEF